jgi:hypothetical protein
VGFCEKIILIESTVPLESSNFYVKILKIGEKMFEITTYWGALILYEKIILIESTVPLESSNFYVKI